MTLSEEQLQQISNAVAHAESRTSGEIVPAILEASDRYVEIRWQWGVFFAALSAWLSWLIWPELGAIYLLWIEVPAFIFGYLFGSLAWVQRKILSETQMRDEVRGKALELFQLRGLSETRDRTGVLILVSLFEHRVEILADSGIHSKVPAGSWDGIVERLVSRIIQEELTSGLCEAVEDCGKLLAEHFPPRSDDRDELPNRPIVLG